jgi:hypothetical protein
MDPDDPVVASMIERCLNNTAPDPLDANLKALHPQIGPLEIYVPDGYIASANTSPSPVHFVQPHLHVPQQPVHYYRQSTQPHSQQSAMPPPRPVPQSGDLFGLSTSMPQAGPQAPAPNQPAELSSAQPAGPSRLPQNHPAQRLCVVARNTISRLSRTDSRVQEMLRMLKQVLGNIGKAPAAEVERAYSAWKASQDGTRKITKV